MSYTPDSTRYDTMTYRRCGKSGLLLPAISLGLWQNFGATDSADEARAMILRAFDLGITHFDLANNYGDPNGSAEKTFGKVLREDLAGSRDELIISTKAGYRMNEGPYNEWGSRKYLLASLDASLARMGLPYVDIFYSHRFDADTPLEETMGALAHAVRSGKALYAGISSYPAEATREAARLLREMGAPLLIHQPNYSMFNRWIETGHLVEALGELGVGGIAFCPLAQGLLTSRYLQEVPADSRVRHAQSSIEKGLLEAKLQQIHALNDLAQERGQSLAQMALAWTLRLPEITSALIGASRVAQVEENVKALENLAFSPEELARVEKILAA